MFVLEKMRDFTAISSSSSASGPSYDLRLSLKMQSPPAARARARERDDAPRARGWHARAALARGAARGAFAAISARAPRCVQLLVSRVQPLMGTDFPLWLVCKKSATPATAECQVPARARAATLSRSLLASAFHTVPNAPLQHLPKQSSLRLWSRRRRRGTGASRFARQFLALWIRSPLKAAVAAMGSSVAT